MASHLRSKRQSATRLRVKFEALMRPKPPESRRGPTEGSTTMMNLDEVVTDNAVFEAPVPASASVRRYPSRPSVSASAPTAAVSSVTSSIPKDSPIGCSSLRARYEVFCTGHVPTKAAIPRGTRQLLLFSLLGTTHLRVSCRRFLPQRRGRASRFLWPRMACAHRYLVHPHTGQTKACRPLRARRMPDTAAGKQYSPSLEGIRRIRARKCNIRR